ncbi:hypothetical protein Bcon01_75100 [Burkholderia contaminans]|nr:hypothetical protein Bcon01_75100 [Burkholderia contaminans]
MDRSEAVGNQNGHYQIEAKVLRLVPQLRFLTPLKRLAAKEEGTSGIGSWRVMPAGDVAKKEWKREYYSCVVPGAAGR